jgi:hypothetical protein
MAMARPRPKDEELPVFPCPACGEPTTPDDLYTCQECGLVGCENDIDVGYCVCQGCLEEYEEELEEGEGES